MLAESDRGSISRTENLSIVENNNTRLSDRKVMITLLVEVLK